MFRSLINFLKVHFLEASIACFLGIQFATHGLSGDGLIIGIGGAVEMFITLCLLIMCIAEEGSLSDDKFLVKKICELNQFFTFYSILLGIFEFSVYAVLQDTSTLRVLCWHCAAVGSLYSMTHRITNSVTKNLTPTQYQEIEK